MSFRSVGIKVAGCVGWVGVKEHENQEGVLQPTHRLDARVLCWWVGFFEAMVSMGSMTPTHPTTMLSDQLNTKGLCWWVGFFEAMVGVGSMPPTHPTTHGL